MSNYTHNIEVCFGAINDVERSIFAATRKARVDFNLCLSEASLAKVATRTRSIPTSR
ncbi:hypothetical protein AB4K20DRAFT_1898913 [Rhizopus microsporus]